jgi:hypothetical protein
MFNLAIEKPKPFIEDIPPLPRLPFNLCLAWTLFLLDCIKNFFSLVHPTVLEQIFIFGLSIPTFGERSLGFGRGVQVLWPFSSCLERKEYRVPSSNQY